MTIFKIAALTIALIGVSTTAQAADFNKTPLKSQTANHAPALIKKARTQRVIKKVNQLPTARNVATHTTRSVLYFNPSKTRTKVINKISQSDKTPNLFKH